MSIRSMTAVGLTAALVLAAAPALAQKKGEAKGKKDKEAPAEVKEAKGGTVKAVDPETVTDPKEKAKAYYQRGKQRYEAGEYQGSLEDFLAAYNTMPNPGVYISISSAYEKLGNFQEAANYLEKYVDEQPNAGNIVYVKEKLVDLKKTPGKVKIASSPPGASITINGETTDQVTPAEIELPGGDHAMALNLEGYIMETRAFTVPIGGEVSVEIELTSTEAKAGGTLALPEQPTDIDFDEDQPKKKAGKVGPEVWAMAGVAGAGLVSATVFGLLALSTQSDFDKEQSQDKKDKGEAFAIVCDVSWAVAAAAAVTGTVLYIVGTKKQKEKQKAASIAPILTPDAAGASVTVTF